MWQKYTISPLSKRLLLVILISSSLITMVITLIQLAYDYKHDLSLVDQRLQQIEKSYLTAVANSVWNFNQKQYESLLDGILSIDDIVYVAIKTPEGDIMVEKGKRQQDKVVSREFALIAQDFGKQQQAGSLLVIASLQPIYDNLLKKTLLILASQAIKTIIIVFVIVFAFYCLVSRHLGKISDFACQFSLKDKALCQLDRTTGETDELDHIVNALNTMKGQISKQYTQIKEINRNLEKTVQRRTLELLEKQKQLEELATHDPLTRIYNRRKMDELFDAQWRYCKRHQCCFAIAIADIDYFKNYNDYYGHDQGDRVLQRVAEVLAACVKRPQDSVSRYGGEEFVIILPDVNLKGFRHVLEAIQQNIEKLAIEHKDSLVAPVITLTIGGVIAVPSAENSVRQFFKAADNNLYQGKEAGRNQIVIGKMGQDTSC